MLNSQGHLSRTATFVAGSGSGYANVVTSQGHIDSTIGAVYAPTAATLYRDEEAVGAELSYILRNSVKPRIKAGDVTVIRIHDLENAKPKSSFLTTSRRTVTCEVDELVGRWFTAIYWDSRGPRRVRFKLEDLGPEDRELVQPRAEFHWSVGTEVREDGRRATTSLLLFRRRPPISHTQWQAALDHATKTAQQLGWELLPPDAERESPA